MLEDRQLGAGAAHLLGGRQHHRVDQLGAGGAHGVQSCLVQAVGVLAVGGVGLAQDADPGAAQALGVAVPRVVLGAFGEHAQQERSVVDAAAVGAGAVLAGGERDDPALGDQAQGRLDAHDAVRRRGAGD